MMFWGDFSSSARGYYQLPAASLNHANKLPRVEIERGHGRGLPIRQPRPQYKGNEH